MTTLSIDIETYSDVDIRSCGAYRYVNTDEFEVLLFAYSINGGEVGLIDLACGEVIPQEIEDMIFDPNVLKTAYNAAFERTCLGKHFGRPCEPEQWECSLVLGAQLGLPMYLQGISEALNLASEAKDTAGKALIRYFCIPCKPTKTNGGRTRNYPYHDIEKWELFREYCRQDVVAENAVRRRLLKYKPNEEEKRFWDLDQKINDSGVRVDLDLVKSAIAIDAVNKAWLTEESIRISGIENPNSVSQVKEWFKRTEGCDIQSLNKKAMPEVVQQLKNGVSHKFLALRSELSKSSTKKYEAIERSVCSDDHVRGVFQFYGANRTGRFAGRLVQLQNLPQNHMPDLAEARDVVKAGEHGVVKAIYDNVTSTLSELIRTAFIPEPGCRFIVADFSAIEARVIAWMANEAWVLDVFNGDGKIYEATASQMFHVPKESISKGGDLRAKGKVAQLACIAKGQKVLTDKGLVPIQDVTLSHKVWDGKSWVKHEGVVYKGEREVITYDGLTATPDHLVWVEGKQKPIHFGVAASRGAHLIQTGAGRKTLRVGGNNLAGKKMESRVESLLCPYQVCGLWKHTVAAYRESTKRAFKRLSKLFTAKENTALVRPETNSSKTALRKPKRRRLQKLRWSRDKIQLQKRNRGWFVFNGRVWTYTSRLRVRPDRYERKLRKREYSLSNKAGEHLQPTQYRSKPFLSRVLALQLQRSNTQTVFRYESRSHHYGRPESCDGTKKKPQTNRSKVSVYDIRNAGVNHRFTVSGRLVHNCGYGGGPPAMIAMGALQSGIEEEELPKLVKQWRNANPNICQWWTKLENAAIDAVASQSSVLERTSGVVFKYEAGMLFVKLPSGRNLCYQNPKLVDGKFGKKALSYLGINAQKQWGYIDTWGGKIAENIVQATARDCLRDVMLKLDERGFDIRMHVHDEVVLSVPYGESSVEELCDIMGEELPWAKGLPLRAAGYETPYYLKD